MDKQPLVDTKKIKDLINFLEKVSIEFEIGGQVTLQKKSYGSKLEEFTFKNADSFLAYLIGAKSIR